MIFSKPNSVPELRLMNEPIIRVHEGSKQEKSFKLVGVHIDDTVSWHHHIDHIRKKVNTALGMLKRSKNVIPTGVKKMIYNSLIMSHLSYCISIWGNAKSKLLDPLVKAQKRALRVVNNEHWLKHCDPLFAKLESVKLNDLYKITCGKLVVKFLQNSLPPGLTDIFKEKVNMRSTRLTDNNRMLVLQNTNDADVQRLPKYNMAKVWNNSVPRSIKDFPEASFHIAYRSHLTQEYKDFICNKKNCFSCESRFIR